MEFYCRKTDGWQINKNKTVRFNNKLVVEKRNKLME